MIKKEVGINAEGLRMGSVQFWGVFYGAVSGGVGGRKETR